MARLTYTGLLNLQDVVTIGDLLLLPQGSPIPHEEVRAMEEAGIIPLSESVLARNQNILHSMELTERYARERQHLGGLEPRWIEEVPMSVRTRLRRHYAVHEEDPLAIVFALPFTGISYMVKNGGLCEALCRSCNLWRLDGIKQLGFLQSPWTEDIVDHRTPLSEGTRYLHSLDVMAVASVMGKNLRLDRSELDTLRTGALTHDMGTPAGGDSIKMIDPAELDEDLNYPALLAGCGVEDILARHRIPREALYATIRNEGLTGELLDIADKVAYVGRDLFLTRHHILGGASEGSQPGLKTLHDLIVRFPYVCAVWDSVVRRGEHAVFTDPARLLAFLKVRVLLFRELYYHPRSRFGEFLMSRLLARALYRSGRVDKRALLRMGDHDLLRLMDETYGSGQHSIVDTCSSGLARCISFARPEEAHAFVNRLHAEGNVFTLIDDDRKSIKTGTGFMVTTRRGIKTFAEAFSADAQEVEEMARMYPMVHVYYLEGDPAIPREKLELLKRELEQQA